MHDASYGHAVALMNRVVDVMGDDAQHRLGALLELLVTLVSNSEQKHYSLAQV